MSLQLTYMTANGWHTGRSGVTFNRTVHTFARRVDVATSL